MDILFKTDIFKDLDPRVMGDRWGMLARFFGPIDSSGDLLQNELWPFYLPAWQACQASRPASLAGLPAWQACQAGKPASLASLPDCQACQASRPARLAGHQPTCGLIYAESAQINPP